MKSMRLVPRAYEAVLLACGCLCAMMSMRLHVCASVAIPDLILSISSFASIINMTSFVFCHSFISLVRSSMVRLRGSGWCSPAILATAHCCAYAVL